MLLTLRGWGPESFARATPQLLAAARHALWAEKAVVMLESEESNLGINLKGVAPSQLGDAIRLKEAASRNVTLLRAALYAGDDE